jgi:hypothetical protein
MIIMERMSEEGTKKKTKVQKQFKEYENCVNKKKS